jgi:putative MATE family efflux protein
VNEDEMSTPETPPIERHVEQPEGWVAIVRQALRGTEADYTSGPIGRALLLLAVPMVLEMAMESVFALADVFWVARLGAAAITTIGMTEALLVQVYAVGIGLGFGVTAVVARRIGEKDPDGAARAAFQALVLGIFAAAVIGVIGFVWASDLLRLLGGSPEVVEQGSGYARIMLVGNATVLLLFLLNAVYRGAGDAVIAMRVLWLANGINLVLDPALIFGWGPFPELGLDGAAIATNIGRGIAVLVQLWVLVRPGGRVTVAKEHLKVHLASLWRLIKLSGTGTLQIFIPTLSELALIRMVAVHGTDVVAGYTVALRIIMFALFPTWGVANAASTMVGQSLGAGKPERAERSAWRAGLANAVFLGAIGAVFMAFAPEIVSWFTSETAPHYWGVVGLRIFSAGFLFYGYGQVLVQSFNGAGDPRTPTIINIGCHWAFEIPAAYVLSQIVGPIGIFLAITIAFSGMAVVSGAVFRRGRWKSTEV